MNTPTAQLLVRSSFLGKLLSFAGVLSVLFCVSKSSAQEVVYRETFYSTVNNDTLNHAEADNPTLGWHAVRSASGAVGGLISSADGVATRSGLIGYPADEPAINAGTYTGTDQGIMFTTSGDMRQGLFYTNEYTDLQVGDISQIDWYAANSSTAVTQQVAVQVDGNWYISSTQFTTAALSGSAFASGTAEHEVLNFSGSTWNSLSYTVGSNGFSISGTAISLPTGNVTGFGLFVDTANAGNPRFDTFEITSIPEPASYAAIASLASLLGMMIWRRRMQTKSLPTK